MLMKNDKKGMAALIISKMGKKDESTEAPKMSEDGAPEDDSIALKTAGEELISAIESKSPMAVIEAVKSIMQLCDVAEDAMESEQE
jgi:hypothetical protein